MHQLLEAADTKNDAIARHSGLSILGILIALAILGLYVQRLLLPSVGLFHDDGVYLVTAKAMATGQGYRIISLPTPIVQTKYPILFPALLAVVWKLFPEFPDNLILLKLVPFLAALAWFALVYRYYRSEGLTPTRASVLTMVLATVPWVLFVSSTLLSETLFFALAMGGLLMIRRLEASPEVWRFLPLSAGALAGTATLTRMAGVALIAAGTVSLFRRSKRAAALFLAAAIGVCLPWFVWTFYHTAAKGSEAYYTAQNYSVWNVVFNYTPEQKLNIVLTNLAATVGSFGSLFEYHLAVVAVLIASALMAGFILDIRTAGFTVNHVFCLVYVALTTLWAWMPLRFLVLLTPMLLLFAYRLVAACEQRTGWRWLPAGALLLVAPMLAEDARQLPQSLQAGAVPTPGTPNNRPTKWFEYARIASWIRASAPPQAVIMGILDPVFYLYTGHPSVRSYSTHPYFLFYAPTGAEDSLGTVNDFLRNLKSHNATVLVSTPFSERKALKKIMEGAISRCPAAFRLVPELPDPEYRVYLVDPARLPPLSDLP